MGRQAVASHMKSVKHVKHASYALTPTSQGTLACFVTAARTVPSSDAVEKRENAVPSPVSSTNASDAATSIALINYESETELRNNEQHNKKLLNFVTNDHVRSFMGAEMHYEPLFVLFIK